MTLTTGGAQGCCGKNSFAPVLEPNGYEDYPIISAKSEFFLSIPLENLIGRNILYFNGQNEIYPLQIGFYS